MAVTGDVWLSLSLGQLVPEIDPNNPGASASLIRDKINEVEIRLQDTISAANNVISASGALLGHANVVGSALLGAQAGIEELVNNAGNTGVYFRLIGICPDFPNSLLRSNQEVASEISKVMLQPDITEERSALESQLARARISREEAEASLEELGEDEIEERERLIAVIQTEEKTIQQTTQRLERLEEALDPCVPNFQGDTAYIGGVIGLIGAPNPLALWDKLKVLAEIFPGLKDVVYDAGEKITGITDAVVEFTDNFSLQNFEEIAEGLNNFTEELAELGENPFFNLDQLFVTNGCDKWACSRLKDIMPALDPAFPGSPMNLAVGELDDITSSVVGTFQQIASLQGTANRLIGEINSFQADLNAFKRTVFDFGDSLASTGIFLHPIGRDASLRTNQDFVNAARQTLFDRDDPGRPTFRGDTALVAGFVMIIGAPNPLGLRNEFDAVASAIQGFNGKIDNIVGAAARTEEAFQSLRGAISTSEVQQQFRVAPSAPRRGGTESTLVNATNALLEGENPFAAAQITVEQSQEAARAAVLASIVAQQEASHLQSLMNNLQALWLEIVKQGANPTQDQLDRLDSLVVEMRDGVVKTQAAAQAATQAADKASSSAASASAEKAREAAKEAAVIAQQALVIIAIVERIRA